MARLTINGLSEPLQLQPGTIRVGRTDSNDLPIHDASVSSRHCELTFSNGQLTVKDLGSTNGTCVNGMRVIEAAVNDGDILKFGSVEAYYEAEAAPQPEPVPDGCVNHPATHANWICQKCASHWCPSCVKKQTVAMRTVFTCPMCDGFCLTAEAYRNKRELKTATFTSLLGKSFLYPFKGTGLWVIFAGAFVYALLSFIPIGFFFGGISFIVASLCAAGYLCAFMQSIISASASGDDAIPEWPDITSFYDDILIPFFQFLAVALVCVVPGKVLMFKHQAGWAAAAYAIGAFCSPMAMLAVSMAGSVSGLNPLVIIPSIFKVFGAYCVAFVVMLIVFVVFGWSQELADLIPINGVSDFIANFVGLYFFSVEMRILGILYYTRKKKLNWFHH